MKRYSIVIQGCDDSAEFEMDLTPAQLRLIKEICENADAVHRSGCQPLVYVHLVAPVTKTSAEVES